MKVCPTNGLQPSWFDSGLEGLWSPELLPRIGYCEYNCNLCSDVCPSGAIKKMPLDVKQITVIGIASINRDRCIPWSYGKNCIVCQEHCPVPTKAIKLKSELVTDSNGNKTIIKLPRVDDNECIGCGICETKCPASGAAAIRVTGITPQKKKSAESASGPASLLPASILSYKAASKVRSFGKTHLFDFIDGGAEVYYEYGFSAAATRDYSIGDDVFTVDVFEMKDYESALGIFTLEKDPESKILDIGAGAVSDSGQLYLHTSEYYVKISLSSESEKPETLNNIGAFVASLAPSSNEADDYRSIIPSDFYDAQRMVLIEGPLALKYFYFWGMDDFARFSDGTRAFSFPAERGGRLVFQFKGNTAAENTFSHITRKMTGSGFSDSATKDGVEFKKEKVTMTLSKPFRYKDSILMKIVLTR